MSATLPERHQLNLTLRSISLTALVNDEEADEIIQCLFPILLRISANIRADKTTPQLPPSPP